MEPITDDEYDNSVYAEMKAQGKRDLNSATIRTTLPMAWTAVILWVAVKLGLNVTTDDLITLAPAFLFLGGIVYRAARALEARFPKLALIFLGSSKTPLFYS